MSWPVDPITCGRCGAQGRPPEIRETIANLEREHRQDGVLHKPPQYDIAPRCQDKDACAQRVRQQRGAA